MELWLYSQIKDFAISKIDQHYLELYQREAVDWSSHQDYLAKQWQHQHLFTRSFYNIEYSIATVAALLFLDNYHKDSRLAIKKLKNAIAQGLTQGFKSVFEVVGIQFPFRHQDIVTAKNVLKFWVY
jgi:oligoendopeptidase F